MEMSAVKNRAFTLIELLVVLAILALLMSIIIPSLAQAKQRGQKVVCLSQLRQCGIAASIYVQNNDGYYPLARQKIVAPDYSFIKTMCWDFTTIKELVDGSYRDRYEPGLLWDTGDPMQIQQCPGYKGSSNAGGEPYTGYNYNTSYIGHGSGESIKQSTRAMDVRSPSRTALFGDGQYEAGANKFMRSPWQNPGDASFAERYAGTQGFRHCGQTNIAFCDGSVDSQKERFTNTYPEYIPMIAEKTGFLSADNSLYDLK
jgi:prepilin-type N-terminal cleavage/methylation domain-containing protein/prepilin-type processing-associated H-X9-DG protein